MGLVFDAGAVRLTNPHWLLDPLAGGSPGRRITNPALYRVGRALLSFPLLGI
jgi:hypothetical protein